MFSPGGWDCDRRDGDRPSASARIASQTLHLAARRLPNNAHMLFVFAGSPPPPLPRDPKIHACQLGVYHQSLNPKSGETILLAPGSYFFGSLNLWNVENVKVLGRGTIVYDGPQDPNTDEGWMQKPDWHCMGAFEAHNVEIDGLTCIVRSRTWSIQMKDSTGVHLRRPARDRWQSWQRNQDGMDWLGGGNTIVRNAFIRASDDVFALQGNWDGYTQDDMTRPGPNVDNISSRTAKSKKDLNIVRAGWPKKIYNSKTLLCATPIFSTPASVPAARDSVSSASGARRTPKAIHSGFTVENLFVDNWYSLVQLEQDTGLKRFTFRNIWALDARPSARKNLRHHPSGYRRKRQCRILYRCPHTRQWR